MIRVWESKDVRSTVDGSLSQLQGSEVPIGSYFLGSKTVAARDGSQKTADLELSLLGKSVSENQVLLGIITWIISLEFFILLIMVALWNSILTIEKILCCCIFHTCLSNNTLAEPNIDCSLIITLYGATCLPSISTNKT